VVTDPKRMLTALWSGYLIAAVFAVAWGVLEYWGVLKVESWEESRVKLYGLGEGMRAHGAFKDPNVYGPFLVPAAVYAAARVIYGSYRLLFMGLLLVFLFGILLSFSRGAWVNCLVAMLVFPCLVYRNATSIKKRLTGLILATMGLLAFLALLGGVLSFSQISERFHNRAVLEQHYDVSAGGRFDTQRKALIQIGTR